jgi:hypothetical protein
MKKQSQAQVAYAKREFFCPNSPSRKSHLSHLIPQAVELWEKRQNPEVILQTKN